MALCANVLAALFAERRESERRLAHANTMLERERDNKLLNAQAITSAIAHEVRQPLAAITASASAALRFIGRTPPDHDEVRKSLEWIISASHHTSEVFDAIRALFRKVDENLQPTNVNEIIRDAMRSSREELSKHRVTTESELSGDLPFIIGHKGQLREVMDNLINNAIEAMEATTERSRVLRVRTGRHDRNAITVAVQDTGRGIDPNKLDDIFGVFVTTKARGSGLGLAICRMIVEQHGGQLIASSDGKSGALFQIFLPIQRTDKETPDT
jgi:signal transduction histidine kinase